MNYPFSLVQLVMYHFLLFFEPLAISYLVFTNAGHICHVKWEDILWYINFIPLLLTKETVTTMNQDYK